MAITIVLIAAANSLSPPCHRCHRRQSPPSPPITSSSRPSFVVNLQLDSFQPLLPGAINNPPRSVIPCIPGIEASLFEYYDADRDGRLTARYHLPHRRKAKRDKAAREEKKERKKASKIIAATIILRDKKRSVYMIAALVLSAMVTATSSRHYSHYPLSLPHHHHH